MLGSLDPAKARNMMLGAGNATSIPWLFVYSPNSSAAAVRMARRIARRLEMIPIGISYFCYLLITQALCLFRRHGDGKILEVQLHVNAEL